MKIALLGDIAFFGKNHIDNRDVFDYFKDIRNQLKNYDFVIANLESPFNEKSKKYGFKSAHIFSDPRNVELLKFLGITVVNLANNHLYDYGKKSYDLTKQILHQNDIEYFGIEGKQVLLELNKNKIALQGYCCYSTNPLGLGDKTINELYPPKVYDKLLENYKQGYNNILSIHAGKEHVNYPDYDLIEYARCLAVRIPYVFYGHHPHVLQGIEKWGDSLIAYSLGNFIFDDLYTGKSNKPVVKQTENNKSSIVLELEFEGNKLIRYDSIPIFAGGKKMEVGVEKILENLSTYSVALKMSKEEYLQLRKKPLILLDKEKKAKRSLDWYFSRLNLRTLFILKDLYRNKQKYKQRFRRFLKASSRGNINIPNFF